ncbi:MAG: hypothetical protein EBR02_08095 [Alphaproteobacteria bacterium]|nr:hypothetical protein [Alphaproteobacteria bacterium]
MPVFDDNSPHWGIPLKGAALREFLASCKDMVSLTKEISKQGAPPFLDSMNAVVEEMSQKITAGLSSDGAQKFGLDGYDLIGIINNVTGVDPLSTDAKTLALEGVQLGLDHVQGGLEPWQSERTSQDLGAKSVADGVLRIFCKCLAWQEKQDGRDKVWKEYFASFQDEVAAGVKTARELEGGMASQSEIEKQVTCLGAMMGWVLALQGYHRAAMRNSPLMAMTREETNIVKGATKEIMAMVLGIDIKKHGDQEKLAKAWTTCVKEVSEMIGFQVPRGAGIADSL